MTTAAVDASGIGADIREDDNDKNRDNTELNDNDNNYNLLKSHDEEIEITILHFNDVYNVEEAKAEPKGGAARFTRALEELSHGFDKNHTMILFSGDLFSPSVISSLTQGRHIPPIINRMHVDCAVLGNHEFDFGLDTLLENMAATNFPWLNSNVFDAESGQLLADALPYCVLERAGGRVRFGVIGLIEREWVDTLGAINTECLQVEPFCKAAISLARQLRDSPHHCHCIIALTHMRWPNDRVLAACRDADIDLILGGHDHDSGVERFPRDSTHENDDNTFDRVLLKSGTDYRYLSRIELRFQGPNSRLAAPPRVQLIEVSSTAFPQTDSAVAELVGEAYSRVEAHMALELCQLDVDLDARFAAIRTQETNVGNLVCDAVLGAVDADVVLLNSGTLRADAVIPRGSFTFRELNSLLPAVESLVVLELTGQQLLACLENSVSQWPRLEGRFLQVAGLSFAFRGSRPPGSRVEPDSVIIGVGEAAGGGCPTNKLELDAKYRVCVKEYLAHGKDGFDVLAKCPVLVDDENAPILNIVVQNYFRAISVLQHMTHKCGKRASIHSTILPPAQRREIYRRQSMLKTEQGLQETAGAPVAANKKVKEEAVSGKSKWDVARRLLLNAEMKYARIAPRVEGRIRQIDD